MHAVATDTDWTRRTCYVQGDPDHSPTTFFPNENSSTKSTRSDFYPTEMSSMRKVEDTKGRRYEVSEIRSLRDPKSAWCENSTIQQVPYARTSRLHRNRKQRSMRWIRGCCVPPIKFLLAVHNTPLLNANLSGGRFNFLALRISLVRILVVSNSDTEAFEANSPPPPPPPPLSLSLVLSFFIGRFELKYSFSDWGSSKRIFVG